MAERVKVVIVQAGWPEFNTQNYGKVGDESQLYKVVLHRYILAHTPCLIIQVNNKQTNIVKFE